MSVYVIPQDLCFFGEMPKHLFQELKSEVEFIQNNFDSHEKSNNILAGHIEKEYLIPEKKCNSIEKTILSDDVINNFYEYINSVKTIKEKKSLKLDIAWANYQKKYEFNPSHNHTGILSFVIWIKIPYDINEEINYFQDLKNNSKNSCFEFNYTNIFGRMTNTLLKIDKGWEGKFCVFPSELNHTVYPFYTSDDYRISVAGNLIFEK